MSGLPKDLIKPSYQYTYPSERQYYDESKSTLADGVVSDTSKSGVDYGIKDVQVTEPIGATTSETSKGTAA